MESILKALSWREATKHFDAEKKLSAEQLDTLLESARLAPSSYGLQPWSFIVVKDPTTRAKLREASWGQAQVTDASELIVFAVKTPTDALIDTYIADVARTRGVTVESLEQFAQMMKGSIAGKSEAERLDWAKKQAYLALGVVITTASTLGIDTCPMEGFDATAYDTILDLAKHDLHTAVILPVGFRTKDTVPMKKVRFAKSEVVIEI